MIRFTPTENSNPQVGDLLLSEPFLNDPYFGRKAVLLCENNESGSFGLVLNNIIKVDITDLISDFPDSTSKVSLGGPVSQSNLFFLHTHSNLSGSSKVVDGIFLGGDFEELKSLIADPKSKLKYRLFIGYSGWSEGQLHEEIKSRSWFVTKASNDLIMNTSKENEEYWKALINNMGEGYEHIAKAPIDPNLN
tara:strand:- start:2 stop:577 length:576 start_codon:yes stop_codon:yes gene_type:complete